MKKRIPIIVVCMLLALAVTLNAEKPARNVSSARHPNLAAAERLTRQAYEKIVAAQRANEWDLGGHAKKAKELLEQVNDELKQAAEAANEHHEK